MNRGGALFRMPSRYAERVRDATIAGVQLQKKMKSDEQVGMSND